MRVAVALSLAFLTLAKGFQATGRGHLTSSQRRPPTSPLQPLLAERRRVASSSAVTRRAANDDPEAPADGFSLSSIGLPTLTQVLFGWSAAISASRLVTELPDILSGADGAKPPAAVGLDTLLGVGSLLALAKSIAPVDYDALPGLDRRSFAREAGEWANAGDVPTRSKDGRYEVATFAGGCFWGTELHFQRVPGVAATCVGYTQGGVAQPTYEQVCGGRTGHTEAVQILFDPDVCTYGELVDKLFSTIPDPTLENQVGNDRGTQYRHGIYPHSEAQTEAARRGVARAQEAVDVSLLPSREVVTEVVPAAVFWPAEAYHQQYLEKGGQSSATDATDKVRCYG